jgi:hypothetical protein
MTKLHLVILIGYQSKPIQSIQNHFDTSELLRNEQKPQGKFQEPHTIRTAAPCIKTSKKPLNPYPAMLATVGHRQPIHSKTNYLCPFWLTILETLMASVSLLAYIVS